MPRAVHRLVAAVACAALLVLCPAFPLLHADTEARALWVVRTTLTSPAAIATMVDSAKAAGFNTLIVQVRGRGDAYYQQALEPRPPALAGQPAFDPLATTIARAHDVGLQVHAWVNVNLVAGAGELPSGRDHVVYRHPEWLMVPRALADDLVRMDPKSPEYVGRLSRYVRGLPSGQLEGLYLSPVPSGAWDYTAEIVRDIAERYKVDGVHLDYVRYPSEEFDYSRDSLSAFRDVVAAELSAAERRRWDARLDAEPTIYTRAFPERWHAFRTARLTSLVERLSRTIRAARSGLVVSAAVVPDRIEARHRLQDWPAWLDRNLIDVLCPMAYTTDMQVFEAQIAAARAIADRHPLWAGIGAYRLSAAQVADYVQTARRMGSAGVILFSYDSLADPSRGPDYLGQVGRAAFSAQ